MIQLVPGPVGANGRGTPSVAQSYTCVAPERYDPAGIASPNNDQQVFPPFTPAVAALNLYHLQYLQYLHEGSVSIIAIKQRQRASCTAKKELRSNGWDSGGGGGGGGGGGCV